MADARDDEEEVQLRSVALQNASSILSARRRAEEELLAAQEALRESHQRVTDILESITDGFAAFDGEWRFTYLNPQGEDILRPLQKTRDSVLGKCLWDEFPNLTGTSLESQYRHAMTERVTVEFEFFYALLN